MNDFIAGLVGGSVGLVIGHPFDTIKALMQTKSHATHRTMIASTKILIKESSFHGFFRGLSLPFISYGPMGSILFGVYGYILRLLEPENEDKNEPTLLSVFIAGTISGTVSSIITNPLEVIKLQLQTHEKKEIHGLTDCYKQIIKKNGYRGFFKGMNALLIRDFSSYGLYFYSYEYLRRKSKANGISNQILIDLVCGGLAGSIAWFSIMPLDVIKSRLQANRHQNLNMSDEFKLILKEFGWKGYFKGTSPVLIRAFLVNSVQLCFYTQTLEFLNKKNTK